MGRLSGETSNPFSFYAHVTLEDDLRRSLRGTKTRQPDAVKLRVIRCIVNDFEVAPQILAEATGLSSETVRMIAAGEGPYKTLPDLGPERTRWVAEVMRDYVDAHGTNVPMVRVIKEALASIPFLVKHRAPTKGGGVAA